MKYPVKYQIIECRDYKQHKCIRKYKKTRNAKARFKKLKEQSDLIVLPKKWSTTCGMRPFISHILILRKNTKEKSTIKKYDTVEGELEFHIDEPHWKIVKVFPLRVEERFYVYGFKKRMTTLQIYEKVLLSRINYFTQILKMYNKIVIDDGENLEVILCKTMEDSARLYQKLYTFAQYQGIRSFLFLGNASRQVKIAMLDRLCEFTGLKRQEFRRNVSKSVFKGENDSRYLKRKALSSQEEE